MRELFELVRGNGFLSPAVHGESQKHDAYFENGSPRTCGIPQDIDSTKLRLGESLRRPGCRGGKASTTTRVWLRDGPAWPITQEACRKLHEVIQRNRERFLDAHAGGWQDYIHVSTIRGYDRTDLLREMEARGQEYRERGTYLRLGKGHCRDRPIRFTGDTTRKTVLCFVCYNNGYDRRRITSRPEAILAGDAPIPPESEEALGTMTIGHLLNSTRVHFSGSV